MLNDKNIIILNEKDNVAVLLKDFEKGESLLDFTLSEKIGRGHKVAIKDIDNGENIYKYGSPIGHSIVVIKKGQHVHNHNIKTNLSGIIDYKYEPKLAQVLEKKNGTFLGYKRADGTVGIRNEIWIINTVGCVNKVSEKIVEEANKMFTGRTDGIFTFTHPFGCSQMGDDQKNTQIILTDLVKHPNAAGVLVMGLGCENNNISVFKEFIKGYNPERVKFLNAQDSANEVEDALKLVEELVVYAEGFKREKVGIENLRIGLKCGGSDGFSGITANPLLGKISDTIVNYGGITILTEVPEMFGAETILMNRCETDKLFEETVCLINNFKEYFKKYNQEIYENPSPGNKEGGISTLEDKSLGCTQKGGTSNIMDVLEYGEIAKKSGLNLLNGPGNDIVSITGLTASGAHMVLFSTGRGTPVGGPVPTIKVSTNTNLSERKPNWIDFDSGILLNDISMDQLAEKFWDYLISVANGEIKTKNEINGYREISIFKDGVTL